VPHIVTLSVAAFCFALIAAAEGQSGDSAKESAALRKERAARREVMRRRAVSLDTKVETGDGLVRAKLIESPNRRGPAFRDVCFRRL
jgi:hypothetical protein